MLIFRATTSQPPGRRRRRGWNTTERRGSREPGGWSGKGSRQQAADVEAARLPQPGRSGEAAPQPGRSREAAPNLSGTISQIGPIYCI